MLEFKISECGLTRHFRLWHCKAYSTLANSLYVHTQGSNPLLCHCNPDDLHFGKKYSLFKLEFFFLFVFGSISELLLI